MEKSTIKVNGMTCKHCEMAVSKALTKAGAVDVAVDLKRGTVNISFDKSKVSLDALVKSIQEAGYEVVD
jgi:copper chaperone